MFFLLAVLWAQTPAPPSIVLEDFEKADYGAWVTTGTALGKGPAQGTLPGQMHVEGFLGKGLVNTFLGGDDATGTLTSPEWTIERNHLNALIGGGKNPESLALRVLVNGKVIGSLTGSNDQAGGSERLEWQSLDLSKHQGQKARIVIVDLAKGGWGHINVDQIELSDQPRGATEVRREIAATRYLHFPVKTGATVRRVKVLHPGGAVLREFDIELCPPGQSPSFWAFCDLGNRSPGKVIVATRLEQGDPTLDQVVEGEKGPARQGWYGEAHRPLVHFTAPRGWLNDPNGLVFDGKRFHLFYQHNPYGWNWGNMHWGHASSPDLIGWTDHPEALFPRAHGDWAFSGSAVLDRENTTGWTKEGKPPLVLAYTSTGRGECIAWSNDDGLTWTEYAGNPVVKHNGRDPKLVWYEPKRLWIMAVFDEAKGRVIHFYSSPDCKTWTFESEIKDFYECPDLVRMPDPARPGQDAWVLYGADGLYLVGDFDGKRFQPRGPKKRLWHGNFYAAQTYANAPANRTIQIGWANGITFPGMPFNQQMTIPVDLTLEGAGTEARLLAKPVREIENYRVRHRAVTQKSADSQHPLEIPLEDGAFDVTLSWTPEGASTGWDLGGVPLRFEKEKGLLRIGKLEIPVPPALPKQGLRVILDRGSVEVFARDGSFAVSLPRPLEPKGGAIRSSGETLSVPNVELWSLKPGRTP